jgi:Tfp pilus assembly protein PilF
MRPPGRRGILPALIASGFLAGACTGPESIAEGAIVDAEAGAAVLEAPAGQTYSYMSLGKQMLVAREPNMALKAFHASMNADGISAEALTGAGIATQQLGLLTSARRYFEQARELVPESVIAHNNLGVVLYKLKEYYPARNAFRRAYALSGGKSEMAERNLNQTEAMIAQIELVPKTDPAISHDVLRLGTSEFRLMEAASPEVEATAE